MPVQPCSPADLLALTGNDPFVRSQSRYRFGSAWHLGGAVAFLSLDADGKARHLASIGAPSEVAELVAAAVREGPQAPRLSVPRGALPHLPAWLHVENPTDWDFRSATAPSAPQPGEERVGWLDDVETGEVKELLADANPESSTWPGDAKVRRWAGIRGAGARLDVCLADTSGANGVGHLSAIATRPETRGRGLGGAITAWATRRLFAEGCDIVTLGMYADNTVARRVYDRLGFSDDHPFTSGVLASGATFDSGASPAGDACPEH